MMKKKKQKKNNNKKKKKKKQKRQPSFDFRRSSMCGQQAARLRRWLHSYTYAIAEYWN